MRGRIDKSARRRTYSEGLRHQTRKAMAIDQWQRNFLRRLGELGGSITVPDGVVNEELIELIEADYVIEGSGSAGRVT